jgi:putative tricarboxylic transport membrane protein
MIISGVLGYFLRRWKFPIAPFIIGIVLGPTTENSIRQSLMMFKGDLSLMAGRPVAVTLLAVAALFIAFKFLSPFFGAKIDLKVEEEP